MQSNQVRVFPLDSGVVVSPDVVACSCCGHLQESELTPSGANLLDGRYAVFGYVVEGQDLLTQLQACSWAVTCVLLAYSCRFMTSPFTI